MTAIVETTSAGAVVFTYGLRIQPAEARELARKLIECAHACDKYNRRLGKRADPRPDPAPSHPDAK